MNLKLKLLDIANNKDVINIKKKPVSGMGYSALEAKSIFETIYPLLREKKILFSTENVKTSWISIEKERTAKKVSQTTGVADNEKVVEKYIQFSITGTAVFTDVESDEIFKTEYFGFAEDKMDKAMPQANTIARKYALCHIFHIFGEEDPEGKPAETIVIRAYLTLKSEEVRSIADVEEPEKPTQPHKILCSNVDEKEAIIKIFKENGYYYNEQYKTWGLPRKNINN